MQSSRNLTTRLVACAAALAPLAVSTPAAAQDAECLASIRIDGHRGTGENDRNNPFPENTIESFEQALAEGADLVEIDVRLSADGTPVVLHYDRAEETTDGSGCVNALTDEQIASLNAGSADAPASVPTLAGVLAAIDGDLNVDVKLTRDSACSPDDPAEVAAAVKAALDGDATDRRVVVSSFFVDFLSALRGLDADAELALLSLSVPEVADLAETNISAVHLLYSEVVLDSLPTFADAGISTAVWTVNDPADMQAAMLAGADIIITDEPDVAAAERADFCTVPDDPPGGDGDGDTSGNDDTTGGENDGGGCAVAAPSPRPLWMLGLLFFAWLRKRRR